MIRHGVPSTLTSEGRVVTTWLPGPADRLRGPRRWWEIYCRLRGAFGVRAALRLTVAAWRHGVVLSGPAMYVRAPDNMPAQFIDDLPPWHPDNDPPTSGE